MSERGSTVSTPDQKGRQLRADVVLASDNCSDPFDDLRDRSILEHIALDAQIKSGIKDVLVRMHCEEDDSDRQIFFLHRTSDLEAVRAWHIYVEHSHVRL